MNWKLPYASDFDKVKVPLKAHVNRQIEKIISVYGIQHMISYTFAPLLLPTNFI